ncbi:MAG: TcpQ domain-containing protein [Micavibrio sp.]|nr:TcpQ domain-containing protein [Micavibrio sp.]
MRMNTNLGGKFFILLAAFGAAVTLGATVTQAGFEWVPPSQPAAAPEVTPAAPNVIVAPGIPPAPSSDVVLPIPGEETTPAPVAAAPLAPPPPAAAPAPVAAAPVMPIPVTPQLRSSDATAANDVPVNTLLDAPSGYQAQPLLPPEENTAMKVREVSPPPAAPDDAPLSITDSRPVLPEPVTTQQMAAPPPSFERPAYEPMDMSPPPVAAAAQQPRVFMPEDAPQTALDNTPNSQKLVINPRPYGDAVPAPAPSFDSVVASATQTPSDKAVLEGFGSDMPLALALQQIVPADYATSFESGVNVGQIVSWDGGKPWDQVVNEMLAPLQLQAVIVNKTVHVRSPGGWRQGDASPAADKNNLRRANIKDPGEQSEQQDANALSDIATASAALKKFHPLKIALLKAEPAAPAETEALPTPEQLNAETPDAAPATTPEAQQDVQQNAQKPALPLLAAAPAPESEKTPANPWEAKAGESLRDILTRWSEKAGVELVWMASYDYKIRQDVALKDDFTGAVESVIATGLDAEASGTPELQIMQKPGAQAPGGILIRDKRA